VRHVKYHEREREREREREKQRERENDNQDMNALRCPIKKKLYVQSAGQPIRNENFEPDVRPTTSFIHVPSTFNREKEHLQKSVKQSACIMRNSIIQIHVK
jgi:hypothetical protein